MKHLSLLTCIDLHSINSHPTLAKAKLDKGAQGNIQPLRLYRRMYSQNRRFFKPGVLEHSPTLFTAYRRAKLFQHKKCKIASAFHGKKSVATFFFVTEADGPAITGLPTSLAWSSTLSEFPPTAIGTPKQATPPKNMDALMQQYPDYFVAGIGKFQGQ